MMLTVDDFDAFFQEIHHAAPFPWQRRLLRFVVDEGRWPAILDLPTGSGKTATMDIALFHLALEAARNAERRAPVRIAFVVDRRLIVDDAYTRAQKLELALRVPQTDTTALVAAALGSYVEETAPPLIVRRLRGGLPREDDWARTPSQPTILCSTVDQVGSRLLFRGYGVSDTMKPVHAGLIGADCLILLDEAHLAEPFRQTLGWVRTYRERKWRMVDDASPWGVALLTATPGAREGEIFGLQQEDYDHPVLRRRLDASKPARLVFTAREKAIDANDHAQGESERSDIRNCVQRLSDEVANALKHFANAGNGVTRPAIGVVVNRVARARALHDHLVKECAGPDVQLLIGPARAADRDAATEQILKPIRTGQQRILDKPLILVTTQCIEAGVDIDLDALITELAPLDSLRQRFGRLNRDGRDIVPYASIIAWKSEVSVRAADPIYGKALKPTWDLLCAHAREDKKQNVIDLGFTVFTTPVSAEALAPTEDAPVLLPAHVTLLEQTSPVPAADPEVAFFLHGVNREPDSINVVWRADINTNMSDSLVRRLLTLVPPRAAEAIALPLWTVRRWLQQRHDPTLDILADTPASPPVGPPPDEMAVSQVFCWKGDDEQSKWISPTALRPGDTMVVPAEYGGVDAFGWNPNHKDKATDVAAAAARPFAGRRFSVRVASVLLPDETAEALIAVLASAESRRARDLLAAVQELNLPEELRGDLERLGKGSKERIVAYTDAYPTDSEERITGVVFLDPKGVDDTGLGDEAFSTTEDDAAGSLPGFEVQLDQHCENVAAMAEAFAISAGLPEERRIDLRIAGRLHDAGKADARFQAWLHWGDPLGADPDEPGTVLAKSGRTLPRSARKAAGLPESWRHEALSVRLAPHMPLFTEARDQELVLWLIGTHHGHGRMLFPHHDPADESVMNFPAVMQLPTNLRSGPGPQSLAFAWNGFDWPMLHSRVRDRYGWWELARMEAILRLADHRASEREKSRVE